MTTMLSANETHDYANKTVGRFVVETVTCVQKKIIINRVASKLASSLLLSAH